MDASRKPLAKVEGRRLMPLSGLTIACRGAPSLDLLEEVPRHVVGRQAKLAAQDAGETVLVLEAEDPAFHLGFSRDFRYEPVRLSKPHARQTAVPRPESMTRVLFGIAARSSPEMRP